MSWVSMLISGCNLITPAIALILPPILNFLLSSYSLVLFSIIISNLNELISYSKRSCYALVCY